MNKHIVYSSVFFVVFVVCIYIYNRNIFDDTKVNSTSSPSKLMIHDDFNFIFGVGSGRVGYDSCRISSRDMTLLYVFRKRDLISKEGKEYRWNWYRGESKIFTDDIKKLCNLLDEISIYSLKDEYHSDILDGKQCFVKLKKDDIVKTIYCNNSFPKEILKIESFINEITKTKYRKDLIEQSKLLTESDYSVIEWNKY